MLKLIKYLKNYKKEAVLSPLFKFFEAGLELLAPLIIAKMIDIGIKNADKTYIIKMGLLIIVFSFVGLVCAILAQYFAAKAAVGFSTGLRDDLFRHIMSLSMNEADSVGRDTLIARVINDTDQIQMGLNLTFRLVLRSPLIVFGALFMAFTIDGFEALIFAGVILLLCITVVLIMSKSVIYYKNVQKKLDAVLGKISENLAGVRVIRAFSQQEVQKEEFNSISNSLMREQVFAGKLSALMNPITYMIINFGIIAILYTGAVRVYTGRLTQGAVVALVNYMGQILVELLKLANLIILMSRSYACTKRVLGVFDIKNSLIGGELDLGDVFDRVYGSDYKYHDKDDKNGVFPPVIEFDNTGFVYPESGAHAVEGINFSIKRGQTIGIIGATGSGKTTLINLIPRFYDATSGSVKIAGSNIKDYTIESLRKHISVVGQKSLLFSGTIKSNLKWGDSDADDAQLEQALEIAQGKEIIDLKHDGLESEIEQLGRNLSGGQKQRISIARSLVRMPEILILDDSSSALDYLTDFKLRKAISGLDKNMTVIIVSQRVSSIKNADMIIVLDEGRIAGIGTHEELVKSCLLYHEICSSQLFEENAV
ncbi:hypothetical protein HMPREF9333_00628 [Johnsonella ignava ATCC 51276]|uniref:ABC transporter n=1 Tax=Johnsonella ignava ATCC 51276 TaxID=679200 RepID=G5GGD8_9FIRM|nr:ABC transporter ATP-binding protein [Johnsonella ignava]EHI56098.1 hypothetical protein HMPREF9333_00628 [Johnsonella ignava ATCC 51276]